MHKKDPRQRTHLRLLWPVLIVLATGCASTPGYDSESVRFYPAPPTPPRIQFLARYSAASDLAGDGGGLKSFVLGEEGSAGHLVQKPYGVALHQGKIYVADTRGPGYAVFDVRNRRTDYIYGHGNGRMQKPINISIDGDGTKYVTDTGRDQVLVFDARDRFVGAFGVPDQFKPIDTLIVGDRLYVSDLYHHRIHVLDKTSGETLFSFAKVGSGEGELFQPTNLALGPQGNIYVSDTGNFRIQKYTPEGQFLRSYGSVGAAVGHFARPKGVALDHEGRLYAVDAAFENVQILSPDGTPLMFFGAPGTERDNINLPTDIIIDYDNVDDFKAFAAPGFELEYLIVVASQFGANKVVVFGFGHMQGMDYTPVATGRDAVSP